MTNQPAAVSAADRQAVTGSALRRLMRSWPTGVAVVTTSFGQVAAEDPVRPPDPLPVGCTVNSFVSVSLCPPLILISLSHESHTLAGIMATGVFSVNVLAGPQHPLAEHFATASDDRFRRVPHRWRCGVPVLDAAAAAVVCTVDRAIEAADHVLVLGIPQWCECDDGVDPLILAGGAYHTLAS
jgi:3-hydroxy-9,10-secoandrosta-1,3,5(10)-triene-9,17-dione monooxygenase reductase component